MQEARGHILDRLTYESKTGIRVRSGLDYGLVPVPNPVRFPVAGSDGPLITLITLIVDGGNQR
ncbi:MAG: hypothetical protein LBK61_01840 [Spirochaetaceae bacterium]|nr:hypothetical protein [Spirochaetaceae bacterium]